MGLQQRSHAGAHDTLPGAEQRGRGRPREAAHPPCSSPRRLAHQASRKPGNTGHILEQTLTEQATPPHADGNRASRS